MDLYPSSGNDDDEDPLLALLDGNSNDDNDADNSDEYDGSELILYPGSDKQDKTEGGKTKEKSAIELRLEKLEQENAALKAAAPIPQAQPQYQPQQVQQQRAPLFATTDNTDYQETVTRLNQKFAQNPGEALLEVFMQGQKTATEAQKQSLIPIAVQNARFTINDFSTRASMDAATRSEFDKLVGSFTDEQLAAGAADPQAMTQHLELVRKIAKATAIEEKEKLSQRSNNPPPFAGGSSSGGGGQAVRYKLTKEQEYSVKLARSQGITDSQINQMLKSGEI